MDDHFHASQDPDHEQARQLCVTVGAYLSAARRAILLLQESNPIFCTIYGYAALAHDMGFVEQINEEVLHKQGECVKHYMTAIYHISDEQSHNTMSREQVEEHLRRAGIEFGADALVDFGGPTVDNRP